MTSGLWTLFSMGAFVAIAIWVFLIKDRKDFDKQASMPLEDDPSETHTFNNKESKEDSA